MTDRRDMPSFASEADAMARVIALAFDVARDLQTPAEPSRAYHAAILADVVRLLTEALEHAWLVGAGERVR